MRFQHHVQHLRDRYQKKRWCRFTDAFTRIHERTRSQA